MMRDRRAKPTNEVKLDYLQFYALQMSGQTSVDNKQINLLSTSGSEDLSDHEYLSELERLNELLRPAEEDEAAVLSAI